MSDQESRSLAIRKRIGVAMKLAEERRPGGYDWGRVGRGDGSAEVIKADEAEAALESCIARFVSAGDESGLGASFNAWLKAMEV
jgi:hypothetical protein